MLISIIEPIPKPEDTMTSLSQIVKASSSIIKAEEISNISNATIVDHETAELLEEDLRRNAFSRSASYRGML